MADKRDFIYLETDLLGDPEYGLQPEESGEQAMQRLAFWGWLLLYAAKYGVRGKVSFDALAVAFHQRYGHRWDGKTRSETLSKEFSDEVLGKFLKVLRSFGQVSKMQNSVRVINFNKKQPRFKKGASKKPLRQRQRTRQREDKEKEQEQETEGASYTRTQDELAERVTRRIGSPAFAVTVHTLIAKHGYDLVNTADRNLEEAMRSGGIHNPAGFFIAEVDKLKGGN